MRGADTQIALIGATGFVGRTVAALLQSSPSLSLRALVRDESVLSVPGARITTVAGSLSDREALERLIVPGCVVINLARSEQGDYPLHVSTLVRAAISRKARRIIHMSSIDVFGAARPDLVDETVRPQPKNGYARGHLAAEESVRQAGSAGVDAVVLRAGAIFGAHGRNLVALAEEIAHGAPWRWRLRRMLNGQRRMHLVPVETIAAAIVHFTLAPQRAAHDLYIVCEDDRAENNFAFVHRELVAAFGGQDGGAGFVLPPTCLRTALRLRGQPAEIATRRFDMTRLSQSGFQRPGDFVARLTAYAGWLRQRLR